MVKVGQIVEIKGQKFFVEEIEYYLPKNLEDKQVISRLVLLGVRE
jgi:hypothetical protein